ncbi:MAG: (d)CMP kinase [Parvibaculaceae bacterium]|jgi:cytidylate kinase
MIIAVDGPAASGKGTLARGLAAHYGLHFLDTGSLYRMVARAMIECGIRPDDHDAAAKAAQLLDPSLYRDDDLRSEAVGEAASIVAVNPDVRLALLGLQRRFAERKPGAVLDGRDIGTVVCPKADVKIFVTASPEVRARRRAEELKARGTASDFATVLAEIRGRDDRDRSRAHAPLVPAGDAHVLDTSELGIAAALQRAIEIVEAQRKARRM